MAYTCDSNLHVWMTNTDKHPVTWWFTNSVYEHNHVLMSTCPSCVYQGGVQETETVLRDVWRAGLGVAALWPWTTVWGLLHLYRLPTVPWTEPGTAALLTSQFSGTTTDSRPVSPDSTDTSLELCQQFRITQRSFCYLVTNQALT